MEAVRMLLLVMSKIGQRYDVIIVVSIKTTIFLLLGRIILKLKFCHYLLTPLKQRQMSLLSIRTSPSKIFVATCVQKCKVMIL